MALDTARVLACKLLLGLELLGFLGSLASSGLNSSALKVLANSLALVLSSSLVFP